MYIGWVGWVYISLGGRVTQILLSRKSVKIRNPVLVSFDNVIINFAIEEIINVV